jgi:hypothetical protein
MAEENSILKEKLKHKSFFNYTDLYNFSYNWLKNEQYLVSEDEYLEKLTSAKEIQIKWKAMRKVSDYYRFIIKVKWHILGMTDVEAEDASGKKTKTNKGDLTMEFEAFLERDYENNWDKHPLWKMMRAIYDKYIIRTTTDEYETKLITEAENMIEEVKAFLNQEGKR